MDFDNTPFSPLVPESAELSAEDAHAVKSLVEELLATPEAERDRFKKILDLIPSYIILLDESGNILFKNKVFDDLFGKDTSLVCHKAMRDCNNKCSFCPPLDSLKSRSSCVMEWISPKNQHVFRVYCYPFEESKGRWLLLKVGTNVTANMRVRQALDLSESSYKAIANNLAIGIAILTLDLKIKAGNSRLVEWFGVGMAPGARVCDVLCCNGKQNVPPSGSYCPDCPFRAVLADGVAHEKEFSVTMLDGQERIVRLVACPVKSQKNKVQAYALMLEDITKRLIMNRHLQNVRKLEAMGALAAGIAHEINQPLSALHLYASGMQMMLEKTGESDVPSVLNRMELIMREAEKIRSIIANMRALVMRDGEVKKEVVNIGGSVESSLNILDTQLSARKIHVEKDIQDKLPGILANSVQVDQIMINLLSNAMHAIDAKNQTSTEELSNTIRIRAMADEGGKKVRVAIADTGEGLPDAREGIFDPFFSTKGEGMGLGLSIVHVLMNQWGGEISVRPKTKDMGGAEFYLLFDAAPEIPHAREEQSDGTPSRAKDLDEGK